MKKNKNNLLIGTIVCLCILIPLFYFTISNTNLNIFNKKTNLNETKMGLLDPPNTKEFISENKENDNIINYGDDGTKASGINHIKVPTIFPKSFTFEKPYIYYGYLQKPNITSTEAPIPGTLESTTNNLKPPIKPDTTKKISPNVVEVPRSYPKNKPNLPQPVIPKNKENITPKVNKPIAPNVTNENIKIETPIPVPTPVPPLQPETAKKITPVEPKIEEKPITPSAHINVNSLNDVEQAIFNQVNVERSKAGLPLLSYNKTMEKYARIKSKDMGDKNYFSHEDLQGNLITVQMDKDGVKYKAWGENIASKAGNIDYKKLSDQFMTQWMNSSGHRANILSKDFQSIGVGLYKIGNEVFATQEFYK